MPGTQAEENVIHFILVYRNLYHASDCAVEFTNPSKKWRTLLGFQKMPMTLEFFGQHLKAPSSVQLLSQSSHPWCIQLKTYFWPLSNLSYRVGNIFKALAQEGPQGGEPCPSCLSSCPQKIRSLWSPPKQRPTHHQGWWAGRESKVRNFNFCDSWHA